eukprot:SAG22_NODE_1401_length_4497_cov_101.460891_1_plen_67_part_00
MPRGRTAPGAPWAPLSSREFGREFDNQLKAWLKVCYDKTGVDTYESTGSICILPLVVLACYLMKDL